MSTDTCPQAHVGHFCPVCGWLASPKPPAAELVEEYAQLKSEVAEARKREADTPTPERVTLTDEGRDDYSDLTSKWRGASESARRAEHHWPADCLAEAADLVDSLAAREQALRDERGVLRERVTELEAAVATARALRGDR